jgi:putative SOS response-associated peptidase YedK
MCTRYVLLEKHYRAVLERLGIAAPPYSARYNIAPGGLVPAVRNRPSDGAREPIGLHWGLIPRWAKTADQKVVNARVESVAEKPSFREALRTRRCVLPASGFYEWKTIGKTKQPWLFRRVDDEPFAFAGLWESWRSPQGEELETCAFMTTAPNALMEPIHTRMPVLLSLDQLEAWLDPAKKEPEELAPLLAPWTASSMTAVTVSSRMNNVRYESPDCIEPVADGADERGPQLSLGL